MHRSHPDTHTHGLDDACPRCAEYAERPTDLDAENMRRLWRGELHTATDMSVYNVLYAAAVLAQRMESAFRWEGHDMDNPPTLDNSFVELFEVGGRR
jgi:tRNA G46 methylase TrmB